MSSRSNGHRGAARRPGREGGQVVEMQRRRLLLAFGEVVADGGLEAGIVGRVCKQAGVSRRTFYELFPDREACLLAAFDQGVERISGRVVPAYTGEGAWCERVRNALSLLLEQLDAEPDIARLCVLEAPRAGRLLLERRRRVLDALAAAVDEGRAEARSGSEPPPLSAQGVVGGVLSVIHARLLEFPSNGDSRPMVELTGPLMAMIVHPYLGSTAARKELQRPDPATPRKLPRHGADLFRDLPIRFTYRTARVLSTIAADPGASNRFIADTSGIADEGQMSRLLRRLQQCELIENRGEGHTRGEPNAWMLTERGQAIHAAIAVQEPVA
jgi:AcrR family transcriptional regulator/DNA-binding MarR family transcriptional regulator